MRTTLKRIITIILCAMIAVTGIESGTAYAAGKKIPLKVAFNGTSANLIKDLNTSGGREDTLSLSTLEKNGASQAKRETTE